MIQKYTITLQIGGLIKGFLNGILKEIMAKLNAECGSLFLFDSDTDEPVLNSFYGIGKYKTFLTTETS